MTFFLTLTHRNYSVQPALSVLVDWPSVSLLVNLVTDNSHWWSHEFNHHSNSPKLFRTISCLPSWSIDPPCLLVTWLETTIICAMTASSYILTHRNYSERSLCFPSWSMYPPSTAHFEPKGNLYWPTATLWRESGHRPSPPGLGCSSATKGNHYLTFTGLDYPRCPL